MLRKVREGLTIATSSEPNWYSEKSQLAIILGTVVVETWSVGFVGLDFLITLIKPMEMGMSTHGLQLPLPDEKVPLREIVETSRVTLE